MNLRRALGRHTVESRDVVRSALRDAGFLIEGPGAEAKSAKVAAALERLLDAAWNEAHRAKAAERLALRGELTKMQGQLIIERATNRALTQELLGAKTDLVGTSNELEGLRRAHSVAGVWWRARDERDRRTDEEHDEAVRRERRKREELHRLHRQVKLLKLCVKSLASVVVISCSAAGTTALIYLKPVVGPRELLALAAPPLVGTGGLLLVWFGRRALARVVGLVLILLDFIANLLQIWSARGGDH